MKRVPKTPLQLLKTKGIWTCRDGQKIKVRDLSDNHLTNILNMLQRSGERIRLARIMELCSASRTICGDAALDALDDVAMQLAEDSWIDQFEPEGCLKPLLDEACKRNLPIPEDNQ